MKKYKKIDIDLDKLENTPYWHIIYLLYTFQHKENGLCKKHFKFTLMRNHGLQYTKKLERFFEVGDFFNEHSSLLKLNNLGIAYQGVVKTIEDLDYYIRYLEQHNIVERSSRKKPHRYKLTQDMLIKHDAHEIKYQLEHYYPSFFLNKELYNGNFRTSKNDNNNKFVESWSLYGLRADLHNFYTDSEMKLIEDHLNKIEYHLRKLLDLKTKNVEKILKEKASVSSLNRKDKYYVEKLQAMKTISFNYYGMKT